jgi:hypothetical protein
VPAGRLRIDMPAAFGRKVMMPILLAIGKAYPALQLTLTVTDRVIDLVEEGVGLNGQSRAKYPPGINFGNGCGSGRTDCNAIRPQNRATLRCKAPGPPQCEHCKGGQGRSAPTKAIGTHNLFVE